MSTYTEIEKAWAEATLAQIHQRYAQNKIDQRAATRAFEDVLAKQPWVKALAKIGAFKHQRSIIRDDELKAAEILGSTVSTRNVEENSVGTWRDGDLQPGILIKAATNAADRLAEAEHQAEREAHEKSLTQVLNDNTVVETVQQHRQATEGEPVAALHLDGEVETYTAYDEDGQPVTVHRNVRTGKSIPVDDNGNPLPPKPQLEMPENLRPPAQWAGQNA